MKKLFFAVCIVLLFPALSHAQQHSTMKTLALDQMYQYGQATYDRGDYKQAAIIFTKILSMNPTHIGAVHYANTLREKGEVVIIPALAAMPEVPKAEIQPIMAKTVSMNNNLDLKQDIQETDEAIQKLKTEVSDLRAEIAKGQQDFTDSKKENLNK